MENPISKSQQESDMHVTRSVFHSTVIKISISENNNDDKYVDVLL